MLTFRAHVHREWVAEIPRAMVTNGRALPKKNRMFRDDLHESEERVAYFNGF